MFGPPNTQTKEKVAEQKKQLAALNKRFENRGNQGGGGGGGNNNQQQKDSSSGGVSEFFKNFFNRGKAENAITGDDFASDLKKASKYLYTQHPYAQELMTKYNLDDGDIIKLRMGMTQPGFQDKISEVYEEKIKKPFQTNYTRPPGSLQFTPEYVAGFFKEGMKPSDYFNPYEEGTFQAGLYDKVQGMPFMQGINALFGSSQGQRGMYFGREQLGLEGQELKDFAASIAKNPNLYNQMMNTPTMQDYDFNEFVYGVRRDLPTGGGRDTVPSVDPDPYDFTTDNPYFN